MIIIAMMAVWRLSYMLYDEDGPFGIFAKLRSFMLFKSQVLTCLNCTSVWVAMPFALLFSTDYHWFVYWLALSTGAILIDKVIDRLDNV
jgi:hypothetical protein